MMRIVPKKAAWMMAAWLIWAINVEGFVNYIDANGRPLRWNLVSPPVFVHPNVVNRTTRAIRYFVDRDLYSAANRNAELAAVRACFGQWQAGPGTILKFEEGGFVGPGADMNLYDNTNVVFWAKRSTLVNGGTDDIRTLRGYTIVASGPDNTIVEADTVLNGVDYGWRTDLNNPEGADPFIEGTLLHEIGHFIGLDHSPVGAATVVYDAGPGLTAELGLSADEIAAVRALYPAPGTLSGLGAVRGRVTMNRAAVLGAIVVAETSAGNIAAGTLSRANGSYELPALAPGEYQVRVSPLDSSLRDDLNSLLRGIDISDDFEFATTQFLPTPNLPVNIRASVTNTLDVTVTAGEPAFRLMGISRPSDHPDSDTADRWGSTIRLGQQNRYVGVVSESVPTAGAKLTITGDGISVGPTLIKPNRFFGRFHVLSVLISISPNATPGLRSFVVQQGGNLAYANGYLEVLPALTDFNFDGLDDTFQRRYFPLFTAPDAGPMADPDKDGFNNLWESQTGSDPTDPRSARFRIESVTLTTEGSLVRWQSAPGKQFQLYSRRDVPGSSWQPASPPLAARGSILQYLDATAKDEIRFYQVQLLP